MEATSTDQHKRSAMLIISLALLLAAGFSALGQWPQVSVYPVAIGVAGAAFLYVYARGSIELCRKVCLLLSLGAWR